MSDPAALNGWRWLEVTNNTGQPLSIQWGSGAWPLKVPPGRWRYDWDKEKQP
jgi:hypothetical protein